MFDYIDTWLHLRCCISHTLIHRYETDFRRNKSGKIQSLFLKCLRCSWYKLVEPKNGSLHYGDVIMGGIASQITSLTIVYSTVYSDEDQREHQSSASLAFVWGIHRGPVNAPHKWPVTGKMFPFDDVIRWFEYNSWSLLLQCPTNKAICQPSYFNHENTYTWDERFYIETDAWFCLARALLCFQNLSLFQDDIFSGIVPMCRKETCNVSGFVLHNKCVYIHILAACNTWGRLW